MSVEQEEKLYVFKESLNSFLQIGTCFLHHNWEKEAV